MAVPNLPRREVGRTGVYWFALGPSARTSGGRLGTATFLLHLVAEGVLSHTLTFECVGQCSWKVLNCHRDAAVVQCTGGNRQRRHHYVRVRHQSRTFSSRISLLSALATTTSLAVPWCTTAWCGSRLPVTAMLSVYPAFSCTVLGLNPELLVSQGSAPTACSTNRIFRSVGFFGYFGQNFGIRGAEHHKRATLTQPSPTSFPFIQ